MTNFTDRYYPTISLRRGEMRAFEKLPSSEKQKILPIVLLSPWLNSIKFENTFNIIEKSIGDQPIIVDLDRYYKSSSPLDSRIYFWSMLDVNTGPEKWMSMVEGNKNYIPCIQILNIETKLIKEQIEWARKLGRGYCVRFEMERYQDFEVDYAIIDLVKNDDCLIIIDFGYSDYSDQLKDMLSEIIDKVFEISPDLRVTITGSNFPNDFSEFDEFAKSHPISSRQIYADLKLRYGNYNFFYGDWASTKPRKYDGQGSAPLPRIDFPTKHSWIIARSKKERWTLNDAAVRITRLPEWENRPKVWGTGMIEKTARGLPGSISTHPEAIAARINIHLIVQANFGSANVPMQPKGKWNDPI